VGVTPRVMLVQAATATAAAAAAAGATFDAALAQL